MKKIILCEGKTDAILLSYFLIKKFGWTHIKDQIVGLPVNRDNEVLNWYRCSSSPDQELAIWGTGGIDEIPIKLKQVIERTRNERERSKRFGKIAIIFDCDERNESECEELVRKWIKDVSYIDFDDSDNIIGQWIDAKIRLANNGSEEYNLQLLSIPIPANSKGNLDTFLVDSIREQSRHDRLLVDEAHKFISVIPDKPYLSKRRYREKACLGSILSVISPDWVFTTLDQRLMQVPWENLESVIAIYGMLSSL